MSEKEKEIIETTTLIKNSADGIARLAILENEKSIEEKWSKIIKFVKLLISKISTNKKLETERNELLSILVNSTPDPKKLSNICQNIINKLQEH